VCVIFVSWQGEFAQCRPNGPAGGGARIPGNRFGAAALNPGAWGEVLELTEPAAISMPELAGYLSDATSRPIRFETVHDEFLEICLIGCEPSFISRVLISLYHAVDAGEFAHTNNHIERLTGIPARGARDYLIDVLYDFRNQPRLCTS